MIVYKIDNTPNTDANTQIREMAQALAEIAPTLEALQELVSAQGSTISSPSISSYRDELQRMISDAAALSQQISKNSQTLVSVSEQARKHVVSIEEHFNTLLKSNSAK